MSSSIDDLIEWRQVTAEDIGFIKKNWLRIFRHSTPQTISSEIYFDEHDILIGDLATVSHAWIACDKEHPFYIYGFVVGSPLPSGDVIVHWLQTRDEWRNHGVARGLLAQLGHKPGCTIYATHWSHFLKPAKMNGYSVVRNDYILYKLMKGMK